MRVVGAGLPRTGTSSLRDALALLLGGPVYHMSEALRRPEHTRTWVEAIAGAPPSWRTFLEEYVAGVDAPVANCWRSVAEAYPDAVVVLSHRADAELWCDSMQSTVLPRAAEVLARGPADPVQPLFRAVLDGLLTDRTDRRSLLRDYKTWNREVVESVPADRLVVWEPSEGWGPLCRALELPVPPTPFPHANSRQSYAARADDRAARDRERLQQHRDHPGPHDPDRPWPATPPPGAGVRPGDR